MDDADERDAEVVCEFFGIKITTRNPNVARILASDVSDLINLDVSEVRHFITGDQADDDVDPPPHAGDEQPDEQSE